MLVEYKKVNVYQETGQLVLKDVDFHADKGEFVYIIGRVGAGKSSLLKTLYFELNVDEAEKADVLDTDLTTLRTNAIPALRRQMGIIFQDFQLLPDRSVYKNLLFVLRATGWEDRTLMDERIDEVLQQVEMTEKKDKMPHELSGGEQQRVAIARAILNHPQLIIADEPTGNLDPDTAAAITNLLIKQSKEGTAVIMSTHNIPLVCRFPGRIYRCQEGKIEEIDIQEISNN